MDTKTKQKRGERLRERLESMKMSQSELIRKIKDRSGLIVNSSHLSMIIAGDRPLNDEYAEIISDILETDLGFFKGIDKYTASSYDEYLAFWGKDTERQERELDKISRMLVPLGFSVGMTAVDDEISFYTITLGSVRADIPKDEIDTLYREVQEFIRVSTTRLIMMHRD